MEIERTRYRFGPLERRGLIAGWRGGQIASVAASLVVAVLVLRSRPNALSVAVAVVTVLGGIALACWPVAGRTGEEWLPTVVRWEAAGLSSSRKRRSSAPLDGHRLGADRAPGPVVAAGAGRRALGRRGDLFADVSVWAAHHAPGSPSAGVVVDRRARTYTAVLPLEGHSFALLDPSDKERRVAGWATALASLTRPGSTVHRVQWLAASLPDDGKAVGAHLVDHAALEEGAPARRSYAGLLEGAGASTCRHEAHLAVQVAAAGPRARALRSAGGGDAGGCAMALREAEGLRRLLGEADVISGRILAPHELAAVVRRCGEAWPRQPSAVGASRNETDASDRSDSPRVAARPWPVATQAEWGCLRADGAWHATYWISEWPRVEVGPEFLAPLLLGSVRRTVSLVMEPLSAELAVRQVEQARTADLADSELRRRGGFLATARRSREEALVNRREEELADGHSSFRFSGYVTVTAPTRSELDEACEATEQAAGQCRLELRRLFGDQDRGFATSLPLCRGLA